MSGGFNDPLIGGGGSLVYPSIHSPNFLTGVRGWSINKNGSAEFNNIIVRNGTFLSGVFLMYSSAIPAKGNLILAFAPVAGGTDAVGNVYPVGFNWGVWDATGTLKSHFGLDTTGKVYCADAAGATRIHIDPTIAGQIFYDTTGGSLGHMVQSIASAAGTDKFGNNVGAGFVSYDNTFGGVAQLISAGLSLFSGVVLRSVLDPNGLRVFNSHGALIYVTDATRDSWFLYADTGSATQGALIASSASAATTDSFGNTVKAGVNSYVSVTGTFIGTYAVTLNDQLQTWGTTVAAVLFQNLTNAASLAPAVTAQTHATAGNNINIQSGKSGAGAAGATIQVQDSVSSSTPGGLVDILAAQLEILAFDGNTYFCGEANSTLQTNFTINSTTPANIFSFPVKIGTYEIEVWMVTSNTTAADAAGFAFSGPAAAAAPQLVKFESKTTGTAVVGYGASATYTTQFNGQGVAGNQDVIMKGTVKFTAAGTLALTGKELVAANTVTVFEGSIMKIRKIA